MAKRTYVRLTTAVTTASYSYLREPDAGREFSDNKYKTTLLIDKNDEDGLAIIRDACAKAAKAEWPQGIPSGIKSPLRDGAEKADKDADLANYYMVTFKSQKAPSLYDSAGKPLAGDVNIFSGDQVRVAGAAGAYVAGGNKGVTLYLNGVQLVEKKAMGGGDDGAMFGSIDGGFTNSESSEPAPLAAVDTATSDANFNF
jgi:hypothetical protein